TSQSSTDHEYASSTLRSHGFGDRQDGRSTDRPAAVNQGVGLSLCKNRANLVFNNQEARICHGDFQHVNHAEINCFLNTRCQPIFADLDVDWSTIKHIPVLEDINTTLRMVVVVVLIFQ